jgi:hypothetical protein
LLVRKTASFFEFSLCLSRARLGKMIVFIYKWLKNTVSCAGISIYLGIFVMSTRVGTDVVLGETRGLPMRWHHLQRGFLQLFLFTFAPVTRRCAELLVCWTVPTETGETTRLVSNLSIECVSTSTNRCILPRLCCWFVFETTFLTRAAAGVTVHGRSWNRRDNCFRAALLLHHSRANLHSS